MSQFDELIERHRDNGLLIDANLLVLYLVGRTNKNRIPTFKRTQQYTIKDFELLDLLTRRFRKLITTPHVLTEVSNLAALHGKELSAFRTSFKNTVPQMLEFYDESRRLVEEGSFHSLGLADASINLASRRNLLVLTDDLELHVWLLKRSVDSINFNHIRTYYWDP